MLNIKELAIAKKAITKFGDAKQTDMAIEEMAELTKELLNHRRKRPSNIQGEIADVSIMLYQLIIIHDCAIAVDDIIKLKLERLESRLEQ